MKTIFYAMHCNEISRENHTFSKYIYTRMKPDFYFTYSVTGQEDVFNILMSSDVQ